MKTFVRLLTAKYEECECSSVGLKRTWQIKTLSVVARARVEANLTSYMMCGFFKQIMLYFQWKILFWLLPTVWWMIMFIIVSYLLGWPHKKLTMSLIDLFPSANDVSTEPQCRQGPQWPPRYHWQLLFASDDHFDHLLWARRISSDNSAAKYLLLRGSDWLIIIWSRTPVFVTRSWTLNNGHRKKGQWIEDCQHRKQVNICTCADMYLKHNIMSS